MGRQDAFGFLVARHSQRRRFGARERTICKGRGLAGSSLYLNVRYLGVADVQMSARKRGPTAVDGPVPAFGDSDPPWLTSPKAHSSKNRREPLPIVVAAAVQKTSSRAYWSVISPSNSTFSLNPATSSVTFAGNDSVPAMVPSARALATACSISRCELTPTIFKNLRMLRLKTSSFIDISHFPMKERFPPVKLSPPARPPHAIESDSPP